MNKKQLALTIIVGILALAINVFIIVQASLDSVRSSESSGMLVSFLKTVINAIVPNTINDSNIDVFSSVIRKLVGHFGLFLINGLLTSWFIYLLKSFFLKSKYWIDIIISLSFGLFVAALTEFIQIYTPGRSGEFLDILIDYSGYILGTGIIVLIIYLILKREKKRALQ